MNDIVSYGKDRGKAKSPSVALFIEEYSGSARQHDSSNKLWSLQAGYISLRARGEKLSAPTCRDAEVAALAASTATLANTPRQAIQPCRTMILYVLISFSRCTGRELTVADCSTAQMMDEEDDVSSHSDHSARTPFSSIQTG